MPFKANATIATASERADAAKCGCVREGCGNVNAAGNGWVREDCTKVDAAESGYVRETAKGNAADRRPMLIKANASKATKAVTSKMSTAKSNYVQEDCEKNLLPKQPCAKERKEKGAANATMCEKTAKKRALLKETMCSPKSEYCSKAAVCEMRRGEANVITGGRVRGGCERAKAGKGGRVRGELLKGGRE